MKDNLLKRHWKEDYHYCLLTIIKLFNTCYLIVMLQDSFRGSLIRYLVCNPISA
jgi:hypothetical protein